MLIPLAPGRAGHSELALDSASEVDRRARHVLALNGGSSSLKFGLYRADALGIEALLWGEAEKIGRPGSRFLARSAGTREAVIESDGFSDLPQAIERIDRLLLEEALPRPSIVAHRIVHGGPALQRHCLIDAEVLRQLQAATAFAPLHAPTALEIVRLAAARYPDIAQVACLDTAFHSGLPDVARVLPLPKQLRADGIHRYGFHGLSCESIVSQLGQPLPERLVIAHLGSGASVTAVRGGRSVDTSMGLTPTGGMLMGTRSGDLDPGVILYLLREKGFDAAGLEDVLDRQSGLLGISGLDSDLRGLHDAAATNEDARLAIDMFCLGAAKQVAAMIAVLNGVDAIVFTGGIGENDPAVRSAICAALSWAGVQLEAARNLSPNGAIAAVTSRCDVYVLPSQENEQMVRHARNLAGRR